MDKTLLYHNGVKKCLIVLKDGTFSIHTYKINFICWLKFGALCCLVVEYNLGKGVDYL